MPRESDEYTMLALQVPRALDTAVEEQARRERRTKRAVVIRALERYLATDVQDAAAAGGDANGR